MTAPTTFSFSVHPGIIDKPPKADIRTSAKNWQVVQLSEQEIAEAVLSGFAMAPQFKGGHRKAAHFQRAGFLAADVDRGMSLDEAREHAFVRNYAGLIHTTASHTADLHRFRIIFLLDEAILVAADWADAQRALALTLGSDVAVSDGARMFFGNTRATIFRIGGTMPPAVVVDLIAKGRGARLVQTIDGRSLPVNSARRIGGPELIRIAGGGEVRMDEIGSGVSVHCPYHDDADPSAFTVLGRRGHIGIHCKACNATFWPADERDGYEFSAFDRMFDELRLNQQHTEADSSGLGRFFPPDPRFERLQQKFLPSIGYEPGITLVKSPKGSGKTEALTALLAAVRAGTFRADIKRQDRATSILLIGHRQSLIWEAAKRLGLRCYLDSEDATTGNVRFFAVCLDSLPKYNESRAGQSVRPKPYDLVIIDESEQVLSHLVGETIASRYGIERCFDALMYEVSNAKAVIALDADLGLVTAHAMRTMRLQDWASRCRIIINAPIVPVQKRTIRLYKNSKRLENEVIEAVRLGQRCFIVSNSKKRVEVLHRMILQECGDAIAMRVITSDNSRDVSVRRFLASITTEILKVQVVLASPSIGTGVDVSFPGGESRVDRVFGFFNPFVNTHTDIDQQLCRVRNPGAVSVWIEPTTFDFTSNVDVVKDDLARAYTVKRAVRRRRPDGMVEYDRDDSLLMICAHVTALQRASKNRLLELFCQLREANGWSVEHVADASAISPFKEARAMLAAERTEMLVRADKLADPDYIELEARALNGDSLSPEERISYEKNHFERTVGVTLDRELAELNADGNLVHRIAAMAEIVTIFSRGADPFNDIIDVRLKVTDGPSGRLEQAKPAVLVAVLLRSAGLTTATRFRVGEAISLPDLLLFTALCRENRTVIEEILGQALRDDVGANPVRQLNRFLRRIGLRLDAVEIKKVAGRKVRSYALASAAVDRMTSLARSYLAVRAAIAASNEQRGRPARRGRQNAQQGQKETGIH